MAALLQSLRDLFTNPTSNFTATAVVVAIVVVLVLAVALVLIAIALPSQSGRATAAPRKPKGARSAIGRRPLTAKSCLALSGLIVFGAAISTAIWYESTSTNQYCTSVCHAMAAPAASWQASTHANVPCVRCHEGPRWRSLPAAIAFRTRSLLLEITGAKPRRHDKISSSRCLGCHALVMEQTLTGLNGETFTHRDFPTKKLCTDCHGAQGHLAHGADEAQPTP